MRRKCICGAAISKERCWGIAVSRTDKGWPFELRSWDGLHGNPQPPKEEWFVRYFCGIECAQADIGRVLHLREEERRKAA